jgi:hypothetical protein
MPLLAMWPSTTRPGGTGRRDVAQRLAATNRGTACFPGRLFAEYLTLSDDQALDLLQGMLE